jgi:hypothetical protein
MGNKVCRRCYTDKPIGEFYAHAQMLDGHLNICKTCVKSRVKKHRAENDSVRKYDRSRYWNDPDRMAYTKGRSKVAYENNKERILISAKNWRLKNPEKRKAHIMVGNAIKNGRLHRQPCEVCGAKGHAHHDDYSRPLEVRWLCPTHHARFHHGIEII